MELINNGEAMQVDLSNEEISCFVVATEKDGKLIDTFSDREYKVGTLYMEDLGEPELDSFKVPGRVSRCYRLKVTRGIFSLLGTPKARMADDVDLTINDDFKAFVGGESNPSRLWITKENYPNTRILKCTVPEGSWIVTNGNGELMSSTIRIESVHNLEEFLSK